MNYYDKNYSLPATGVGSRNYSARFQFNRKKYSNENSMSGHGMSDDLTTAANIPIQTG